MRRTTEWAWTVVALLLVAACSPSIKVQTDYNPQVSFSGLHTFAWLSRPPQPGGDPRAESSILAGRVRRAVVADLRAKGYREVAPNAKPDFFVTYHAAVDEKIDVRSTPTYGYGYGYGYRGWWGPPPMTTETTVHQYELGTLLIDIVDRERDDLIWRGSGQAKLKRNDKRTSAERDEAMKEAVTAILKGFPPTS